MMISCVLYFLIGGCHSGERLIGPNCPDSPIGQFNTSIVILVCFTVQLIDVGFPFDRFNSPVTFPLQQPSYLGGGCAPRPGRPLRPLKVIDLDSASGAAIF
jgi:hypothetical protein